MAYEFEIMKPLIPTYVNLIVSALVPIWFASFASLVRPKSAAKPKSKKKSTEDADTDEVEEVSNKIESLSASDALLFPILAGVTLATLYFLLKYLEDPAWLNWGMNLYFSQMGLFFATRLLSDTFAFFRNLIFPRYYTSHGSLWELDKTQGRCYTQSTGQDVDKVKTDSPFPGFLRDVPSPGVIKHLTWSIRTFVSTKATLITHIQCLVTLRATPTILDLFAFIFAAVATYIHTFVAKPWLLTNFLGASFCYGSLQLTSPSSARTGTLLLCALFLYDIYFVFYTPMMVHVATNLDVPIKMLFPRPDGCVLPAGAEQGSEAMNKYLECLAKKRAMAMLGLGDIVVPGLIIAFALRWDLYLHYQKLQKKLSPKHAVEVKNGETQGDVWKLRQGSGPMDTLEKTTYRPVTGGWGDRFWTAWALRPESLKAKSFNKPYFYATVAGYILGLCTTVVVMQAAKHAQPALLYLVPGVLCGLWGTALVKGEVDLLWRYVEDDDEEEEEEDEKTEKKSNENTTKKALPNGSAKSLTSASGETSEPPSDNYALDVNKQDNTRDHKDAEEDVMAGFAPSSRAEMKYARQHFFYFAIKPLSPSSSDKKMNDPAHKSASLISQRKRKSVGAAENINDPEPAIPDSTDEDAGQTYTPSPTSSSSLGLGGGATSAPDGNDDSEAEDSQANELARSKAKGKGKAQKPAIPSRNGLRISGGSEVVPGLDEQAQRRTKRQRRD
jgi:minor histocompatibility antigen H13